MVETIFTITVGKYGMKKFKYIIHVIGLKTYFLAAAIFLIGNLFLYFLFLKQGEQQIKDAQLKFQELTDTYVQMKTIDYKSLTTALQEKKRALIEKQDLANMVVFSEEDVPHFVTKMERAAAKAGLKLSANVEHPSKKESNTEHKFTGVGINMNFSGSFMQTVRFLQTLDGWQEPVYISHFSLSGEHESSARLGGGMRLSLYAEK